MRVQYWMTQQRLRGDLKMDELKLLESVVTWNVGGDVFVIKRGPIDASAAHPYLDRWTTYSGYSEDEAITVLLADALAMIIRDKCNPATVNRALLRITEYSMTMPFDTGNPA